MEVVVNRCFGGFGLSDAAFEALIKKGWAVTKYNAEGLLENPEAPIVANRASDLSFMGVYNFGSYRDDEPELRTHPDIISAVKELGDKVNNRFSELEVVEVPDDIHWHIEEYDGLEYIAEDHRTWP